MGSEECSDCRHGVIAEKAVWSREIILGRSYCRFQRVCVKLVVSRDVWYVGCCSVLGSAGGCSR